MGLLRVNGNWFSRRIRHHNCEREYLADPERLIFPSVASTSLNNPICPAIRSAMLLSVACEHQCPTFPVFLAEVFNHVRMNWQLGQI